MKKFLFLFLSSIFLFIPDQVFAVNWDQVDPPLLPFYNYNTTFTYSGTNLNVADFYTFGSGNQLINVSGSVKNFEFRDNFLDVGQNFYLYVNLNLCTDANYTIHSPNMIDHMYVYNSSQSCNFNGSAYKGHVAQIYFRVMSVNQLANYSGTFYLNADREHSVELINYQANFEGFPIAFTNDYTDDLNDLKNILRDNFNASTDEQKKTNEKLDELNDNLTDSDTTEASSSAGGFFGNFEKDNHGLSSIITAPLEFVRNLLGHSCQPLTFTLPFVDEEVSLPCIKPIYQEYFGLFFNLYQVITTGVIAYAVIIRIFAIIKGLQDPQNDRIEVLKL